MNDTEKELLSDAYNVYDLDRKLKTSKGLYGIINDIGNNQKVKYIMVICTIMYLMYIINVPIIVIIGLLIGIFVVYFLFEKDRENDLNYSLEEELKLNSVMLRSSKYMHHDSDMIDLMYDISEFMDISRTKYNELITNIDEFFAIEKTIEDEKVSMSDKIILHLKMRSERATIINIYASLIFNIDIDKELEDKYKEGMKKLELILNQHLIYTEGLIRDKKGYLPSGIYPLFYPEGEGNTRSDEHDFYG